MNPSSESYSMVGRKISAVYQLNKEIIAQLQIPSMIEHVSYEIVQKNTNQLGVTVPQFKVVRVSKKTDSTDILKRNIEVHLKNHLFSDCTSTPIICGFENLILSNDHQMSICERYQRLLEQRIVYDELQVILENMERIQVGLGEYQKLFLHERPDTHSQVVNQVNAINLNMKTIFRQFPSHYRPEKPQAIALPAPLLNSVILSQDENEIDAEDLSQIFNNLSQRNITRIYQATVDGWDPKDFHSACDQRGATLTIMKDTNNNIFGGYTTRKWSSHTKFGVYESDPGAYLFSLKSTVLEKCEKFPINSPSGHYAIFGGPAYSVYFGAGGDIKVRGARMGSSAFGITYSNPTRHSAPLPTEFTLREMEVFLVE